MNKVLHHRNDFRAFAARRGFEIVPVKLIVCGNIEAGGGSDRAGRKLGAFGIVPAQDEFAIKRKKGIWWMPWH